MSGSRGCFNPVPTAPIIRRIEEFIEQNHFIDLEDGTRVGGISVFCKLVDRDPAILNRLAAQEFMERDLADYILTKLGLWLDWYTDPVLREVYETPIRLSPAERAKTMRCDAGHDLHEHGFERNGSLNCRECDRERSRAYAAANRDRIREMHRDRRRRERAAVEALDVLEEVA